MTKISILGCGWLGLPLAKALLVKGFSVNGSTTSQEKLSILQNAGINPFLIQLDSKSVSGTIETFLQESTILVLEQNRKNIKLAVRNIPDVKVDLADSLNAYEVLSHKNLMFEKLAIAKFK